MLKQLFIVSTIVIVACDHDGPSGTGPALTLSADSVNVAVGANTSVTATISNATGTPQFVSRDETVATVNGFGVISGVAPGMTYVVSSVIGMPNVRDSVRVRVTQTGGGTGPLALPLLGTGAVPERYTGEVAAMGNVAYTGTWSTRTVGSTSSSGNAIKVWNVGGNQPVLVDSLIIAGAGTVSDVQIADNGELLVASLEFGSNGLAFFNLSNPLHPTFISRYTSTNVTNVHTVKLSRIGGRLYAFCSASFGGRLIIVDITNPSQPVDVFSQAIATTIHDVFIRDGVLFTAIWHTGLRLYDVGGANRGGTPSAPVEMGTVRTAPCSICGSGTSSVHNVWWFHDPTTNLKRYAFVGEEGPSSLFSSATGAMHVVDVSNFNSPREVAVYEPDPLTTATTQIAGAHNFVMDEPSGILYAAFYNGGVRALDVRGDLSSCTASQKTADLRCDLRLMGREVGVAVSSGPPKFIWGVAMVGNYLYASDMPNGLHKIDISGLKR